MNMVVTTTHGYLNKVQQHSLNYATCVLIGPRLVRPANDIGDLPYNALQHLFQSQLSEQLV